MPVDFSYHAAIAFNQAKLIADEAHVKVSIVNLFEVPVGYYKTGESFENFALVMEGHAVKPELCNTNRDEGIKRKERSTYVDEA